jgi:Protein of unknown function (DUF2971)
MTIIDGSSTRATDMTEEWAEANTALDTFRGRVECLVRRDLEAAKDIVQAQSTVFHYTDVTGALGILKSGTLWFTERAHLNDPIEVRYGLDIAHKIFETAAQERGSALPPEIAAHLKAEHTFGLATYGFWVSSFSLTNDDLTQWRNYADDGRGVCLGFSIKEITDLDMIEFAKPLPNQPNSLRFPVSYDQCDLRNRIEEYANLALNVLQNAMLTERPSYGEPYGTALLYERDCFRILTNGFYANSILHKHPSYQHEKEYRLLVSGPRDTILNSPYHHLRDRKGEIVGYLDLPIPRWKEKGVLTHIRLGPAAPEGLKDQLRLTLAALSIPLPIEIDQSTIPFRHTG